MCPADPGILAVFTAQQVADLGRPGWQGRAGQGVIVGLQDIEIRIDQQNVSGYVAQYFVVDAFAYLYISALIIAAPDQKNTGCRQYDYPYR